MEISEEEHSSHHDWIEENREWLNKHKPLILAIETDKESAEAKALADRCINA